MSGFRDALGRWLALVHGFQPEVAGLVPGRRFRADWAKAGPAGSVCVEYDGIMRGDASHMSIANVMRDQEKSNLLQLAGHIVIRCSAKSIQSGDCHRWVEQALASKGIDP